MKEPHNADREDKLRIQKDDLDDVLEIAARLQTADENQDEIYEGKELEAIEKATGVSRETLAKAHQELQGRRFKLWRNVALGTGALVLAVGVTSGWWWKQVFPPDPAAVKLEADMLRQKAVDSKVAKKYSETIALAKKATELDPTNYLAWNILGVGYDKTDRPVEAREAYLEAAKQAGIRREAAVIYFNLGGLFDDTPDTRDEAIGYYRKAIQCNPNYSEAHNNLAWALDEQGKTQEALAAYQAAVKADASNKTAAKNLLALERRLGTLPVSGDLTTGMRGIELRGKAMKLNDQKKYKEAIQLSEQAVKLVPTHILAWNTLGLAYEGDNRLVDAAKAWRKAVEVGGDHQDTRYPLYNLGRLASDAGKHPEAIRLYTHAIARYPDYAWAHNQLGVEYEKQGQTKMALAAFERAVAADADNKTAKKNLARLKAASTR